MIRFFNEDINFIPTATRSLKHWIKRIIQQEKHTLDDLNFIFCSDSYLHKINQKYLNHNTYTDIITFDHSEDKLVISGDVYISVERLHENALEFKVPFEQELRRVMAHGVLHLLGFGDKSPEEQREMKKKEEAYLSL